MLDLKYITENIDTVIEKLNTRGADFSYLKDLINMQEERRNLIKQVEDLKARRNEYSKMIGQLKREKKDATDVLNKVEVIKHQIPELEISLRMIDDKIHDILIQLPNIPSDDVPIGLDETANRSEERRVGKECR